MRRAGLPVNNVISAGFGMICSCEKAAGRQADRASAGIMNFMDTVIGTKTADTIFHGEFVFWLLELNIVFHAGLIFRRYLSGCGRSIRLRLKRDAGTHGWMAPLPDMPFQKNFQP